MKMLLIGLALASGAAAAAGPTSFNSTTTASLAAPPALYSFVDVYRLTVAGAMSGQPLVETAPDAPIRVSALQAQPNEPRFSVVAVPPPDKWLLLVVGLALAGWVAHRRLVHAL